MTSEQMIKHAAEQLQEAVDRGGIGLAINNSLNYLEGHLDSVPEFQLLLRLHYVIAANHRGDPHAWVMAEELLSDLKNHK